MSLQEAGARMSALKVVVLLFMAISSTFAETAMPCTATFGSEKSSVSCVGAIGDVYINETYSANLLAAVDMAMMSPTVEITFEAINFSGQDFQEAVEAVLSAGSDNVVEVLISNCSMVGQAAWVTETHSMPLGAQYTITMESSSWLRNQILLIPIFGSGSLLDFTVRLMSSEVVGNQLMTLPLGMANGDGLASFDLTDSEVHSNQVMALGAFAAARNGYLAPLLEGSVVSNNMVTGVGMLALGGKGNYQALVGPNSEVMGNNVAGQGLVVQNQALVVATVQLISKLAFADPSLNITQILDNLQQEFCKVFPDDNEDMEELGLLGDLMDALRTVVCGDGVSPPPSLGALVDIIRQFLDTLNNTAGASLENLLARLSDLPSLLPQLIALLPLLQNLSLESLLSPQTIQPLLNIIQQLLAPLPGPQ